MDIDEIIQGKKDITEQDDEGDKPLPTDCAAAEYPLVAMRATDEPQTVHDAIAPWAVEQFECLPLFPAFNVLPD
jgi:hypothetical protein